MGKKTSTEGEICVHLSDIPKDENKLTFDMQKDISPEPTPALPPDSDSAKTAELYFKGLRSDVAHTLGKKKHKKSRQKKSRD